ncbi:uncharacterized protein A4U43_C01F21150 [Asparagus officinalis]|uniref:PB1-like domain-containing protein n=1 Tax=Asparagus officinalis TaxID=4686 RepID=A0A5P1FR05_ASPOF|nr:uncharacterized protein A4U43_C01F21150 [Asparagus officinalis]
MFAGSQKSNASGSPGKLSGDMDAESAGLSEFTLKSAVAENLSEGEIVDVSVMGVLLLVKFRHGGYFNFENCDYINGRYDVKFIDEDAMSIEFVRDKVREFGYTNMFTLWYGDPGRGLNDGGLMPLHIDYDLDKMLQYARSERVMKIFSNHGVDRARLVADVNEVGTQLNQGGATYSQREQAIDHANAHDEIAPMQEN